MASQTTRTVWDQSDERDASGRIARRDLHRYYGLLDSITHIVGLIKALRIDPVPRILVVASE